MTAARPATALQVSGFYFLFFATLGITLPFLPAYFGSLSFSATEVGVLLALSPLFVLVSPPLFGHLADRTGRADRALLLAVAGAFAGFLPLLFLDRFAAVFGACAAFAFFNSAITTLADSLALRRVALVGGSYSHLRLFGSLGFIASSAALGLWLDAIDRRVIWVVAGTLAACVAWALFVRSEGIRGEPQRPLDGIRLVRGRGVALLLAATALHWIACSPYNGMFSLHITALGLPPSVVGVAAGVGVAAEVAVMALYPRFAARFAPRHVLFVSFAATAIRWAVMAGTSSGPVIVAVSVLHGLTFGSFYVASVGFMARRVPEPLRASGQALFAAATFGLGGLVGYVSSGAAYDAFGGHRLFAFAALLECAAAVIALWLRPADPVRRISPEIQPSGGC